MKIDSYTIGIIILCVLGVAVFAGWGVPFFIMIAKDFWQLALM